MLFSRFTRRYVENGKNVAPLGLLLLAELVSVPPLLSSTIAER